MWIALYNILLLYIYKKEDDYHDINKQYNVVYKVRNGLIYMFIKYFRKNILNIYMIIKRV